MEIGRQLISTADVAPVAPVAPVVPAVPVPLVVPENPVVPVALVVPENPGELAVLETGPVVALELVINPVVVPGPETALVVAPEREADQVALPLRIKSVTGPRRHDQVLLLTVEDLAVEVAETTRVPAAAEGGKAWAAAE